MDMPLALSVILTSPPAGSPSDAIARIVLQCETVGLSHTGNFLYSPLTEQERLNLRWYLEEYWKWPFEGFAKRGKQVEALLPKLGKRLYEAIFESVKDDGAFQSWESYKAFPRRISIVSDIPRVLSLPWELLHDEQSFLTLCTPQPISIVRRLVQQERDGPPLQFEPPLRVLLVSPRPVNAGFVDPRSIARELLNEMQGQIEAGAIEIEFLRPPTFSQLRARLEDHNRPVHILHFDGHGVLDEEGKRGLLAFENDGEWLNLVKAGDVGRVLHQHRIRLAVLTACHSASTAEDDALSSIAAHLLQEGGGLDAVVAMSASILTISATHYAEAFYRALGEGVPAQEAQEHARQALHGTPYRHPHRRHRDEEAVPVELYDWWIPHFYQQHHLLLQLQPTSNVHPSKDEPGESAFRLSEGTPPEPRYGFTGRAHELLQIERSLIRGRVVVIYGLGGIGKTALVREAADWLTRSKMYDRACFVSLEHGADATTLLNMLGHYLEISDSHYDPNDHSSALLYLRSLLKENRFLVIAENLESILSNGEAPLAPTSLMQVWDVLLGLAKMGVGILLTSRSTAFGDERMEPGSRVVHLALQGLHPEDAYMLARRLLDDLLIDRTHVPYKELRDMLVQLDHHPLAIQLVLPALRDLPLAKIRADFEALLPNFVDDKEAGRNRSLLTSLDYSLRRLSEEQQRLLPLLAVFEGGANEATLLDVTEFPEAEWIKLRSALEQAALLTVEQVHRVLDDVPFLHFHPVLMPFLRTLTVANNTAVRERYTQSYYALADFLYVQDFRIPTPIRALVSRELPNLRRALAYLLEAGKLEEASILADRIAWFLFYFGLTRERDEIRRSVTEAVNAAEAQDEEVLMLAEYLHECGLANDEFERGDFRAASARFGSLLARIQASPVGRPMGRGSYEHRQVLHRLARCLNEGGQPAVAEDLLREALMMLDAQIRQHPDNQNLIDQRTGLLGDLGIVFLDQGKYLQTRLVCGEVMDALSKEDDLQEGKLRTLAGTQGLLGKLALKERKYDEARTHYLETLELFHFLQEPAMEAKAWHQLGQVAMAQKDWAEAERCYRESLEIDELLGNVASAAKAYHNLAEVTENVGRTIEAEGWLTRALKLDEKVQPGDLSHARSLNNLAALLVGEVQAASISTRRLIEAKEYAEQALEIMEVLDATTEIWATLSILAKIAFLEGRAEAGRNYLRREREAYIAFAGNRSYIDNQYGALVAKLAAAAQVDAYAREKIEADLPRLGVHLTSAIQRMWAGERDYHSLVEELNGPEALLVLRVLEIIAREKALEALSPERRQKVTDLISSLENRERKTGGDLSAPDWTDIVQKVEPFLRAVELAARDITQRSEVEKILTDLETEGWRIRRPVQRIWSGERDIGALTAGLTEIEELLVQQVLKAENFEALLWAIATAVGDAIEQSRLEALMAVPGAEQFMDAVRRIWAGERDITTLVKGLNERDAVAIQRVLEVLAQSAQVQNPEVEQVYTSLPLNLREAMERGDEAAFHLAFDALSTEEQRAVEEALLYLEAQQKTEEEIVLKRFEPLLQAIARIAKGDIYEQSGVEEVLNDLETKGFRLREAVRLLWDGARDATILTMELDERDTVIVQRVLEIIAEE